MPENASARLAAGWLTLFVVGTDLFVVSPLLPRIAADFGVSPPLAGLAVSLFSLSYLVAAPILGHAADRIGRRRMLSLCLAAFAGANLLTAAAADFGWLLAARLVAGGSAAGIAPSVYALVGGIAPARRRASWLAFVVSGLLLALALGAPLAGLAGAVLGWPGAFLGLGLASAALAVINRRLWPDDRRTGPVPPAAASAGVGAMALRLAPMAAWSTAVYGMYTYLGTGLAAAGFSPAAIAETIAAYGAGAVGGLFLGGRLADRFGVKHTGAAAFAALALGFVLVRLALDAGMLVDLALALTSAAAQLFFPAQQAGLVADFPARRASILAWNNSTLFLGISLGSLLGGQAVATGGFATDLLLSAALAAAGFVIHRAVVPSPAAIGGATGRSAA